MNKLSIARTVLECCLGGGCIAGGVECAKAGKRMKSKVDQVEQKAEMDKKDVNDKYEAEKGKREKLEKENECFKKVTNYAKDHFNNIGSKGWDATTSHSHARDAKHGLKTELDKCGNTNYANSLNWN